jgi:peptide-methionine (S)-S-oxide reductase
MTAVFYHDEEQQRSAEESLAALGKKQSASIYTQVLPLTDFTLAEDYHQKFYLQQRDDLMANFLTVYPDFNEFLNSTAAARVNGELGGSSIIGENGERITNFCLPPGETS